MRASSHVSTFQWHANRTDWPYTWTIGVVRDRISQPLSVRIPSTTFDVRWTRAVMATPQKGLKSDLAGRRGRSGDLVCIDGEEAARRAAFRPYLDDGRIQNRGCGEALREGRVEQRTSGGSGNASRAASSHSLARSRGLGRSGEAGPRSSSKPSGESRRRSTTGGSLSA